MSSDRIEWYKTQSEGQRIIDMLKIVREQICLLEPHELGKPYNTIVKEVSVESVDYVIGEAIRVIKSCYFPEDVVAEEEKED